MEVGALKIERGREGGTFQRLVNPSLKHISPRVFKLCPGITEEELRRSPSLEEIEGELLHFIKDTPLACHNAVFEKKYLTKGLGDKLKSPFLCTLELFSIFKPHFTRHGLDYLLEHYLKEERVDAHRALADARYTWRLFQQLITDLATDDYDLLQKALELMVGTTWGWLPYLQSIVPPALRHGRGRAVMPDKKEAVCKLGLDDLEHIFENEANWTERFPGYKLRPQQQQIALCAAESLRNNHMLFMEAPTGSGKTLAYLAPSLIWAATENEKVFISTNTRNLQQQVQSELPRLAQVLGIENIRFSDMKGVANYACRRRLEEEAKALSFETEDRLARVFLYNWSRRSPFGELDDISYWLKQHNPSLNRLLSQISCRREECDGSNCFYHEECFYRLKVQAMRNAHLCTINHALLLTWPGHYPELRRLVIDEAHTLEEKAFEAFTREVSSSELSHLLKRLYQSEEKGYFNFLRIYSRRRSLPSLETKTALSEIDRVKQRAGDVAMHLDALRFNGGEGNTVRIELTATAPEIKDVALALAASLFSLSACLDSIITELNAADEDFENTPLYQQGENYKGVIRSWSALLEECFKEEEEEEGAKGHDKNCRYLECSRWGWAFRIAPLDLAEHFYGKILTGANSVLLTSATLAEKGGYSRVARSLGFQFLKRDRIVFEKPLPPVYNYRQNSVLAIPQDSPGYRDENFNGYIARVILTAAELLDGRTLALFTSLERMEKVMEQVRLPLEKEGISVLGGRNSSRRADLEHFREDKNAVLFGSRSYFEGVDVSGPALSCIIIDKLSFPFQKDPLVKARERYLKNKGLNPFQELSLAEAARTLRQQFGRLIRTENDKGFVFVIDQLKGGKWYSSYIINELPAPTVLKTTLPALTANMKNFFQ